MSFLTTQQVRDIVEEFSTPVYVYDQNSMEARAREALNFPNAYGLDVGYAMKALSNAAIIRMFADMGLYIDASSGFEAERAIKAGVKPDRIQITAQQIPLHLKELVEIGVKFNASSLSQLRAYGEMFPGTELSVRVNPGLGSGHSERTNTGGPSSSFGIWHEHLDKIIKLQEKFNLKITKVHTHIGSGSDPDVWDRCARMSLDIVSKFPNVDTLNLGGGYKVARMPEEVSTDLLAIGVPIAREFEDYHEDHGRKLKLEIEPGTYLVANAGVLIASVIDVVDTGKDGYNFIKIDSGMTEVLRPGMYGAQHPIDVVPVTDENRSSKEYIIAGHCCESGDILTPLSGDPEGLKPRLLTTAKIGDAVVVGGSGAYCSSMSPINYNSFPQAPEVLITRDGSPRLIRKRQTLEQIIGNEV